MTYASKRLERLPSAWRRSKIAPAMQITVHIGINICKTDSHPGIIRFIKSSYSFYTTFYRAWTQERREPLLTLSINQVFAIPVLLDKATVLTPFMYIGYYVAYPEGFAISRYITERRERLLLPSPTTQNQSCEVWFMEIGIFKRFRCHMSHSAPKSGMGTKITNAVYLSKQHGNCFCRKVRN